MTNPTALDAALVPSHEHPYPIPANWLWVYLGKCIRFEKGKKPEILSEIKFNSQYVPYANIKYFETQVVQQYADIESTNKFCVEDDILLVWDGARSGLVGTGVSGALGSTLNKVILYNLNKQYIYLFFQYKYEDINSNVRGTGIPHVDPTYINSLPLPLPPLEEQARIVAIIERLFTQLDDAKAILGDILASLDDRKSAILHQAFAGELTQNWREERGLSLDSWQQKNLGEVCTINPPKIKTAHLSDQLEVSFIPMTCVSDTYGKITEFRTAPLKNMKQGYTNFIIGDILFAKITPCMENGKIAIVESLVNNIGYGSTEFYVFRCDETAMFNKYLYYFIRNTVFRKQAREVMVGAVGQQRVPKYYLENYPVNLPPIEEQQEIVRVLDSLLSKEDELKNCANRLEHIDLLKKTILAWAFRGELSTNNPGEPSCEELLKQMLAAPTPKKERNISIKMRLPKELKSKLRSKLEEDICSAILNKKHAAMKDLFALHQDRLAVMQTVDVLLTKGIIAEEGGNFSLPGER